MRISDVSSDVCSSDLLRDAESGRPAMMPRLARYLPVLEWGRAYGSTALTNDLVAAGIVTIMLIPQSLAYAMLAGLPPEVGLYASILLNIAYALFGTSRSLAVGPVAVIALIDRKRPRLNVSH